MIITKRTNAQNIDFQLLVKELDIDLAIRDGEDHTFYAQFNTVATIKSDDICTSTTVGANLSKAGSFVSPR